MHEPQYSQHVLTCKLLRQVRKYSACKAENLGILSASAPMAALLPLLLAWASLAGLAEGQWVAANSTGGADNAGRLCGELELCTSSNYTWAPVAAAARGPEEACALLQQKGLKTLRLFGDSFGAPPPVPGPSTSFGDFCLSEEGSGADDRALCAFG